MHQLATATLPGNRLPYIVVPANEIFPIGYHSGPTYVYVVCVT